MGSETVRSGSSGGVPFAVGSLISLKITLKDFCHVRGPTSVKFFVGNVDGKMD